MKRREFLQSSIASTLLVGCQFDTSASNALPTGQATTAGPPNILVILVDEMRVPPNFPFNLPQTWQQAIPWMASLWSRSACFTNHFTASSDCSPSRASRVTGLYGQQHYLLTTRASLNAPSLQTAFPTYGTMLRGLGYDTYWFGKWHLSELPLMCASSSPLEVYGFSGGTCPDPDGTMGQGSRVDMDTAAQFNAWLAARSPAGKPWCATLSLINPHDVQWFWKGSNLCPQEYSVAGQQGAEAAPPTLGYDSTYFAAFGGNPCANFENPFATATPKPAMQQQFANFTMDQWGPLTYSQTTTTPSGYGNVASKPFDYWYKLLQLYLFVHGLVDKAIGSVLTQLWAASSPFASNTVIVFTSDHGEYAGAHGQRGKGGMAYEEGMRVPLSVYDPTGQYVTQASMIRSGCTSSVDLAPLLLTLGSQGSVAQWKPAGSAYSYLGARYDISAMLKQPAMAPGRSFVLYSTDELLSGIDPKVASHVVTYRSAQGNKLSAYNHWQANSSAIDTGKTQEFEYYNLNTDSGEMINTPTVADAATGKSLLLGPSNNGTSGYVATELQAQLPANLRSAQTQALAQYYAYIASSQSPRF